MDGRRRRVPVRRAANLVNGSTLGGLLLARLGRADVVHGPDGLWLATDYRAWFPAPRAAAVTVGDVVLLRMSVQDALARPHLLRHEARHAAQWAQWVGPVGFLPAYGVASAWSWLRHGHPGRGNWFEVRAGLEDGGYVRAGSPRPGRRSGPPRRRRRSAR